MPSEHGPLVYKGGDSVLLRSFRERLLCSLRVRTVRVRDVRSC
jgi:hypothetical protein